MKHKPWALAPSTTPSTTQRHITATPADAARRPTSRTLSCGLVALILACQGGAAVAAPAPALAKQTVCTITINSSDEKDMFVRHLPPSKFNFVELVERNRPDWLASACQAGVRCDVLLVSGHYDGVNQFFSDKLETSEYLPVDELERVSCSASCPGLFSRLKEVHLYGCDTLSSQANSSTTAEVARSLVREGHSQKEAERQRRALAAGHGESSRDRMRQVFKDVPVIYGFSSVAPLGPVAGATLNSYFRGGGAREVGSGRTSKSLLSHFAPFSMTVTQGMTDSDPHAAVRQDVCKFADERVSDVDLLGFVHQVLQRETAQARVHLERIQRHASVLNTPARRTPDVDLAFAAIANDSQARARFLDFARDADQPAVRARMFKLALDLGWLTADQRWSELALMLGELQQRSTVGVTEVDLACTLNLDRELDGAFNRHLVVGSAADDVPHAAMRACLGSAEAQTRMLDALVSVAEADVKIAQAYLRHRPINDAAELQRRAQSIARMPASDAQVRALEALGRHYVSDREILDRLIGLFVVTPSHAVQTAIAGILIRADLRQIVSPKLVSTLQKERRRSLPGTDVIDALIRRLQAS